MKSPATAELSDVEVFTGSEYLRKLSSDLDEALTGLGIAPEGDEAERSAEFEKSLTDMDAENRSAGISFWYVLGLVDSQNGFGATVRNEWTCDVKYEHGELVEGPNVSFQDE